MIWPVRLELTVEQPATAATISASGSTRNVTSRSDPVGRENKANAFCRKPGAAVGLPSQVISTARIAARFPGISYDGRQIRTAWEPVIPDWFGVVVPLAIYFAIFPGEFRSTGKWHTGLFG
jgi:hypothetical protein